MAKKAVYDNDSISSLKGADRVRKRPGVIFGSDGLEGCEHAVFEILSNAIDEAREGHGRAHHRHPLCWTSPSRWRTRAGAVPVDWNEKEQRYNWELVFCELYAGGKYDNTERGQLRVLPGPQRPGLLRHPVRQPNTMDADHLPGRLRVHPPLREGRERRRSEEGHATDRKKTGTTIPLEARPGGVHRHRHPGGLLPGRAQAPGGGQRRGHLPACATQVGRQVRRPRTFSMKTASRTM